MSEAFMLKVRIPASILPYPSGLWNQAKYIFWKGLSPFFATGQNLLLALHIIHHEGRQRFILGRLASGKKLEDFLRYLETAKFGNHFIAWKDDGEVIGLRKLEGFEHQYHLRVFKDGEVRGHFEFTPEAHMIWHMKEVGMEERREDFLRIIGSWLEAA